MSVLNFQPHWEAAVWPFVARKSTKKKSHLVDWGTICTPKKEGGLGLTFGGYEQCPCWVRGFGGLEKMLITYEKMLFWKSMVRSKGWDVEGPSYRFSNVWKGAVSIKDIGPGSIRYRVGSINKVPFWACYLGGWQASRITASWSLQTCKRHSS